MIPPSMRAPMLAAATVAAAIALGFLIARAARRRERRLARERAHAFESALAEFLAGRLGVRVLRRAARRLDRDHFWSVVDVAFPARTRTACRALEDALAGLRFVGEERRALRDDSPWRRVLAARRLAWIGARRHMRALRRAMVAGPPLVSLAAASALGRARDGAALGWMLAHPLAFAHRPPRAIGAALQSFGRGAMPRLHAALEERIADPVLERAVLDTLANARHVAAIPTIAARLEHPWRDVRVAAARALGRLGASDRAPALIAALRDPEWQVRSQAARALGRVRAAAAVPALTAALRDGAWWVRRHAAYALARLGEAGRSALREAAASDPDRYARDMAAEALAGGFAGARPERRRAS